ncbi:hypothetical protein BBJ28_00017970 [Nothophytophthora sp. Chile5]|nr:hypothetical protein BBJ28_00017970 [Nothophytophthora sp. Chile5]
MKPSFDRLTAAAEKIVHDVKAANPASVGAVHPIACNIRSEAQVAAMMDETLAKFKRLDFLVNNGNLLPPPQYDSDLHAGSGHEHQPVSCFRYVLYAASIDQRLIEQFAIRNGTFLMIKKAYHAYMKEHGGRIVNIIILVDKGHPGVAHSAAARAGIENLAKSLSVEWASSGITLNCVAPVREDGGYLSPWR